ncbi:MAG: hypothetical protein RL681_311 [Candidatus Parcubacteria bacterium]|jgi:hypothetical protein
MASEATSTSTGLGTDGMPKALWAVNPMRVPTGCNDWRALSRANRAALEVKQELDKAEGDRKRKRRRA